jgi:hypothetical protein
MSEGRVAGDYVVAGEKLFQSESSQSVPKIRRNKMATRKTPPIVSQQEWEAARQQLLAKEKALTRSRDALAAERRRTPPNALAGCGKEV